MSTTLLSTTADGSPLISDGFRVALTAGGAVGISARITTGGAALTLVGGNPIGAIPLTLILTPSNFTDGAGDGTVAATTQAQFGGAGAVSIPLMVSATASDVRHTEVVTIASGPVMYGFLSFPEQLSADVTIVIEALEL